MVHQRVHCGSYNSNLLYFAYVHGTPAVAKTSKLWLASHPRKFANLMVARRDWWFVHRIDATFEQN